MFNYYYEDFYAWAENGLLMIEINHEISNLQNSNLANLIEEREQTCLIQKHTVFIWIGRNVSSDDWKD